MAPLILYVGDILLCGAQMENVTVWGLTEGTITVQNLKGHKQRYFYRVVSVWATITVWVTISLILSSWQSGADREDKGANHPNQWSCHL